MNSTLKNIFEKAIEDDLLVSVLYSLGKSIESQKGKIISYDDNFLELRTYENSIFIKIDTIIKIKFRDAGDGTI